MTKRFLKIFLFILLPMNTMNICTAEEYLSQASFLQKAFGSNAKPDAKKYWITAADKSSIQEILGHPYAGLRVRYWQQGQASAWILDEIGKVKPITVGIVIEQQNIRSLDILAFRESRGWEVKYPFFTSQFQGAKLADGNRLNHSIDNITGATLSVRAVTKMAQLALFFAQKVASPPKNVETTPHAQIESQTPSILN